MKSLIRLLLVGVVFIAAPALAGETEVQGYDNDGACSLFKLCDDQVGSATCGGSGNERYIKGKGFKEFLFTADTSDAIAEAFTVKIYTATSGQGYSANRALVNSSDITNSNNAFVWKAPLGDFHAVTGGTNVAGVTVIVKACP